MNLILFGFKSCGKTFFGRLVAHKLHRTFVDIDRVIEDIYLNPLAGRPKPLTTYAILTEFGEEYFRTLERDAVRKVRLLKQAIIATGGGAVVDYYNHLELKKNGLLVYLKAPKEVLKRRLLAMKPLPAILDPNDPEGSFENLYLERISVYERIADVTIDTQTGTVESIVDRLCALARG